MITAVKFQKCLILPALLLLISVAALSAQTVVINEVVAANAGGLQDTDGEFPDWIELYNSGDQPIDLNGYGISDKSDEPFKWLFPPVMLEAKQFLVALASGKDRRDARVYWETVIDQGDSCKYLLPSQNMPTWKNPDYNDATWKKGVTGIGFGDGDDATVVSSAISVYIRQKFIISDTSQALKIYLHVDFDDAFVAWLNGREISRANIGVAGQQPSYNLSADNYREAEMYQGGKPMAFDISEYRNLLNPGENLLAIAVHNYGSSSSDLSLIPFLSVGYRSPQGGEVNSLLDLPVSELHTNFKINAAGEWLGLTDAFGAVCDSLTTDSLPLNISLGRQPDGSPDWFFFEQPTPGAANSTQGFQQLAPQVELTPAGGFYASPISVALATPESLAVIRFTLNGDEPDSASAVYDSPIAINATSVLKTRAFKPHSQPGPIRTATYFIGETSDLPVVSISVDSANLWDYNTGIYVMGPNADPNYPYFGANFWQDWERPAFVEFYEKDRQTGFKVPCGIKIFGNWSRAFAQKSLAIHFRDIYGLGKLEYNLFPNLNLEFYDAFVLRNSGNDWESTLMRDGVIHTIMSGTNVDRLEDRPVIVYLNGEYWGIHNLREKINEDYLEAHHGVDPREIDLLENNRTVLLGTGDNYAALMNYIDTHNMTESSSFEYINGQIDVNEYIDYICGQIYVDNTDWPGNNIRYWRPQAESGVWRWLLYDTDFGFGLYDAYAYSHNTLDFATEENGPGWPNPPWSTYLLRKLLENPQFRMQFVNRFSSHLNITFAHKRVSAIIDRKQREMQQEMPRHAERWSKDYNYWLQEVQRLHTFSKNRVAYVRLHLTQHFGLASSRVLNVASSDTNAGSIRINDVAVLSYPFSGSYFPDYPVIIEALPNPGYRFKEWSGSMVSNQPSVTVAVHTTISLTAHFEPLGQQGGAVCINEINYHSATDFDSEDWIEIYNSHDQKIDCGGWLLKDDDNSRVYTIPAGTSILADSFLVITRDKSKFTAQFPDIATVAGDLSFGLNAAGDQVRLYDAAGMLLDSVQYDDEAPWPLQADGLGPTLELKNPQLDNTAAENWQASSGHGTPNRRNSAWIAAISNQSEILPLRFWMGQNYPNPFNSATKIEFELAQRSKFKIEIFDINGRRLDTILAGVREAGHYAAVWQAPAQLASGVYFYRLSVSAGENFIGKMILIR